MEGAKPWFDEETITDRMWSAASRHRGGPIKDGEHVTIEAILLIQDGNMGGNYVRVITWTRGNDDRHFHIYRDRAENESFFFSKPVAEMQVDDVVTNEKTGQDFKVVLVPKQSKWHKVLEPV